mmetsp:Transcript_37597/g.113567  ORF Transcript_37597/g.113567 Transcript_37597/m.113567 type:complete len:235 (-) Transcript_37597:986-1690(-)
MTPAITAMEVMDSSCTMRCFVDWSRCKSFSMTPPAYLIMIALSNSSPKLTKADIAMAATRSTGSSIFFKSTGMTVWCQESWNSGAWSLDNCPIAWRAVYLTLGCGCSTCWKSNLAMAFMCALSSTYSTVCFTAVKAANFACHASCWQNLSTNANNAALLASIVMASTMRSIASSPLWYNSSTSSSPSSSSMRSAHSLRASSPSSTSSMKSMQHSKARAAKFGKLLASHLLFLSV